MRRRLLKRSCWEQGKQWKILWIWLHPSGILGASPDGNVDHETVLEAKCPYTERNFTIEEAAKSETFCLEKTESGQYALRKHHFYWHQVQGEMYFTHRKFCYFVVWTTLKDVAILRIERKENWATNIPRWTQFYLEHIFPKIVEGKL